MTGYEIYKEAQKLNLNKDEFKKLLIEKHIIIPKMWIKITDLKPKHHGAYIVYGRQNIGTPFESKEKFIAFWAGEQFGWTDKDGDDYNQLNEGIEYWININHLPNP